MTRVVESEVKDLIPDTQRMNLAPFVKAANVLVNRMVSTCTDVTFSDDELKEIEKWTAAHFTAISDPSLNITEEKVEGSMVKANRGNINETGLMSTQYGQMANTLSGGCLVEADKRKPTVTFV